MQAAGEFKGEPQNARLPCEALCIVTVAVTLIGMANLLEISTKLRGIRPIGIKLHHSKFLVRHSTFGFGDSNLVLTKGLHWSETLTRAHMGG